MGILNVNGIGIYLRKSRSSFLVPQRLKILLTLLVASIDSDFAITTIVEQHSLSQHLLEDYDALSPAFFVGLKTTSH